METEYATIPIKEFNSLFEGKAKIEVINGYLEITVGGITLMITLPEVIGGQSTASS